MKIKSIFYTKEKALFMLEGVIPAYVNTLRRLIVEEVPTMAVDTVKFYDNGSALYDEMIALRIGLIPLTTDLKTYEFKDKCKCGGNGCAMCELKLSLDKEGPCTVYSKDLVSTDPKVKPAIENIPIVKLLEGQKLKLEATAILGNGKMHIKFSPGLMFYSNFPNIKVRDAKVVEKCMAECPMDVAEFDGKNVKIKDYSRADTALAYLDLCPKDAVEIKYSEDKFIVSVESWGQLDVREMLMKAVDVFNDDLDEFASLLKQKK